MPKTRGEIIWITGQVGSGKSTILNRMSGVNTVLLDENEILALWFDAIESVDDRWKFELKIADLAILLSLQGFMVVVATLSPFEKLRKEIKNKTDCAFIFVDHNEWPDKPYEDAWDAGMIVVRQVDEYARERGEPISLNRTVGD